MDAGASTRRRQSRLRRTVAAVPPPRRRRHLLRASRRRRARPGGEAAVAGSGAGCVLGALLLQLAASDAAVVRNPAPPYLYTENRVGRGPEFDTFEYKAHLYPSGLETYSCGQYVRARLSVTGMLGTYALGGPADHKSLALQEGQWQWLNTSAGEAGLMLIKHYVNGDAATGNVNYCNSTYDRDVIAWSTDLSAASGERPVVEHSSATGANVYCGASDSTCVRDSDAQSMDAFATFELPCNYAGPFRLCYRKTVSRFRNDTDELGWWSPYQSAQALSDSGGSWGPEATALRYAWQEPDGDEQVYDLNSTGAVFYTWHTSRSSVGNAGEWATVQVHASQDAPVRLSASSDRTQSDQVMLVPKGSPCIAEASAPAYPGTVFSSASGQWQEVVFDEELVSWAVSMNGTFSPRVGAVSGTTGTEYNPYRSSDHSYSVSTSNPPAYVLAFLYLPYQGEFELCYSSKEDRALASALYTTSGTTYLDARLQGPGGWRKLTQGAGSNFFSFTAGAADTSVRWSSSDTTAGSWGQIRLRGSGITPSLATQWDSASGTSKSYEVLIGGDQARLVPYVDTVLSSPDVPAGCWSNTTGEETRWLQAAPSASRGLWETERAPYGTAGTSSDGYFYLRFPVLSGDNMYKVCYRPAGGQWRVLEWDAELTLVGSDNILTTAVDDYNVSWAMNDTRAGTWGPLMLVSTAPTLTTQKYDWELESVGSGMVAVKLIESGQQCQPTPAELVPGASAYTAERFILDVGLQETAKGEALAAGRFSSDDTLRSQVAAWITVPAISSGGFAVCFRLGSRNWQTVSGYDGVSLLYPRDNPGLRYELADTRAGTWGAFLVSAYEVVSGVWGSPAGRLSSLDDFKILPNDTQPGGDVASPVGCDRSTALSVGLPAAASAAFCSSTSSDPLSPCYTAWTRDQAGVNPLIPALDFLAVYHFLPLPAPSWPAAYTICYQQLGMNWIALPPLVEITEGHRVTLVRGTPLTVPGGTWHRFEFVFTGTSPPISFDLGGNRDSVKLVLASENCSNLEVQSAITTDLLHPTNASLDDASGQATAAAELPLPYVDGDTPMAVRVCYRHYRAAGGRNNWIPMPEIITVEPSGIRYSLSTSIISRGVVSIRFISRGLLDTRPGRDAFKLVSWSHHCRADVGPHEAVGSAGAGQVGGLTDLGPTDTKGTAIASTTFVLPSGGGSYRVCYFHASGSGKWTHLLEESDADSLSQVGLLLLNVASREGGMLVAAASGIVGVETGEGLLSAEGEVDGRRVLVGGLETDSGTDSTRKISIIGSQFQPDSDAFKLVRTASLESSGWVSTGRGCEADAEPGTYTTTFLFSGTAVAEQWMAPVFSLPLVTGRFYICYKWNGVSGGVATWVHVPVERLSYSYVSGLSAVISDDTVQVMSSQLFFSIVDADSQVRVVVEDHFLKTTTYDHAGAPSLTPNPDREDLSDWLRIVPQSTLCQDLSVATAGVLPIGNVTATKLLVEPYAGSPSTFASRVSANLTSWPPADISLHKVCYRKLSALDSAGGQVRAPTFTWMVLPSLLGRTTVQVGPVDALVWVGGTLLTPEPGSNRTANVTAVGAPFTVRVRTLTAQGLPVPGRHLVALYDAERSCRTSPSTCSGSGSVAVSWQCQSGDQAVLNGWPANNTLQWTDSDGYATFEVVWTEACTACTLQAQVVESVVAGGVAKRVGHAATPVWTFAAESAGVSSLTTSPLPDTLGFMEGASIGSPLYVTADLVAAVTPFLFSVIGLSAGGARAYVSGAPVSVIAGVENSGLIQSMDLYRDGRTSKLADRDSSAQFWRWDTELVTGGQADFRLVVRPTAGFVGELSGIDISFSATGENLPVVTWKLRVVPVVPAHLQITGVTPDPSPMPRSPKWEASGWPFPLVQWGLTEMQPVWRAAAAPGYHLMTERAYTVHARALDAGGREAPGQSLQGRRMELVFLNETGGDATPQSVAAVTAGVSGSRAVFSFVPRRRCASATPCTIRMRFADNTDVKAEMVTPIRSPAVRLAIRSAQLKGTAGAPLGPFNLAAVDAAGDVDEWFAGNIWPLIEGGDGHTNNNGVGLTDTQGRRGMHASQRAVSGLVTFAGLRLTAPCPLPSSSPCRINFLSDEGLSLLRTDPVNVTDGSYRLSGAVSGGNGLWDPSSTTPAPVGQWITVTLTVVDSSGNPTDWVNEWFIANQFEGTAPMEIEGGRAQRLNSSKKVLRVRFVAKCVSCKVRFTVYPRDGWWSSSALLGSWDTPGIVVTERTTATRLVLQSAPKFVKCTGPCELPPVPNAAMVEPPSTGRPWFHVLRGETLEVSVSAVDVFGALGHPNTTQATRLIQVVVTKQVGDDVLDGNGGAYTTDPLIVRQSGLSLVNSVGKFEISFPRPCLQCLITLQDADSAAPLLTSTRFLLTVRPSADAIRLHSAVPSLRPIPYGGQASTVPSVWLAAQFLLVDGDTIDYTQTRALRLQYEPPPWTDNTLPQPLQQELLCDGSQLCEPSAGAEVVRKVVEAPIATQILARLAGNVTPRADFLVAGRHSLRNGTMRASVGNTSGITDYVAAAATHWLSDYPPVYFNILEVTDPHPPWMGFSLPLPGVQGYLGVGRFPKYNYTKASAVPGVPWPLTVSVTDRNGTRVSGAGGTVTATLEVPSAGCGSGGPLTDALGEAAVADVVAGNATLWLVFGTPCDGCIVRVDYRPADEALAPPIGERTKYTAPIAVRAAGLAAVVVEDTSSVPDVLTVGDPVRVVLRALDFREQHPVATSESTVAVVFNKVMDAGDAIGTADPSRVSWGNGAHIAKFPDRSVSSTGGVAATFTKGVATVELTFLRGCDVCSLEVVMPALNATILLRTVTGKTVVKVLPKLERRTVVGVTPAEAFRDVPFSIGFRMADENGDRVRAPTDAVTEAVRLNAGGNGDGGLLVHSNGAQSLTERQWAEGVQVWRLHFTSACLSCEVGFTGSFRVAVQVHSPAERIEVMSMVPADGAVATGEFVTFDLIAVDNENNRDYTVLQAAGVALSSDAYSVLPPVVAQWGSGGTPTYNSTLGATLQGSSEILWFEKGLSRVKVQWPEPVLRGFLHFFLADRTGQLVDTSKNVSSAGNAAAGHPAPPTVTVTTPPDRIAFLQHGMRDTVWEGNPVELWVGIVDNSTPGWIASAAAGLVQIVVEPGCIASNVTVTGGLRQSLVDGALRFTVDFRGLPAPVYVPPPPTSAPSTSPTRHPTVVNATDSPALTNMPTAAPQRPTTAPSAAPTVAPSAPLASATVCTLTAFAALSGNTTTSSMTVRVLPVAAERIGFVAGGPPRHAVKDRPLHVAVAGYDSADRRAINAAGWMYFSMFSCDVGHMASRNATLSAEGLGAAALTFTGAGACVVEVAVPRPYPAWRNTTTGAQRFDIAVQQPVDIMLAANITSEQVPVLRAGVAYPLLVRVVDEVGAVVQADIDSQLTVEIIRGPRNLTLRNENAAGVVGTLPTGQTAFGKRTEAVRVSGGEYLFMLAFSGPTGSEPARFQIAGDFKVSGAAPVLLGSELFEITVTPTRLRTHPAPPASWVTQRTFQVTVQVTDDQGNMPLDAVEPWRISWGLNARGVEQPTSDFIPVPPAVVTWSPNDNVILALTERPHFTYHLKWIGADGAVEYRASAARLTAATGFIRFQTPVGLQLSRGAVSEVQTLQTLSFGVSVVDAAGEVVVGDSLTEIRVAYSGPAVLHPSSTAVRVVAGGKAVFDFQFTSPGDAGYFNFTAKSVENPDTVWWAASAPFNVVHVAGTPVPVTPLLYTPPKLDLLIKADFLAFDPSAFAVAVSNSVATATRGALKVENMQPSNVNVLRVCPATGATDQCRVFAEPRSVLVGAASGAGRTAAAFQRGGAAPLQVTDVTVSFQIVLRPDQGLVGGYQEANSASFAAVSLLESALQDDASAVREDFGAASSLTVTDLQATPTPVPTVAAPTPQPTDYVLTPADKDLLPRPDPPKEPLPVETRAAVTSPNCVAAVVLAVAAAVASAP